MFSKTFIFFCFSCCAFANKIPEITRVECALKMHNGFCLQSVGQSTSTSYVFNEGYQEALKAGISPKKMHAIGNLFMWYRKFGHYLGMFETYGREKITDEYWIQTKLSPSWSADKAEKRREAQEIAEISRDMIFAVSEMIGGLLGVVFTPELVSKAGSVFLITDGISRFSSGFNRLKTKNDIIAYETRLRLKELEAAAAETDDW